MVEFIYNRKKRWNNKRAVVVGEKMEEYLNINEAEEAKTEEAPIIEKTTIKLIDTGVGELKVEEEK